MSFNLFVNRLALSNRGLARCKITRLYATNPANDDVEIPVNPLKKYFSANQQKENGEIYQTRPFKILCEEGKMYNWCLCGRSKSQPFCDGTHNNRFYPSKLKPIKFTVTKTKEYWLCNCKHTLNRPFCDGTHIGLAKTLTKKL